MIFEETTCPICGCSLVYSALPRFDKYHCRVGGHYTYLDLFESKSKTIAVELKDYSLAFRYTKDFDVLTVYKEYGGSRFIMNIPIIQFEWDKLDVLNERIKTLVLFS